MTRRHSRDDPREDVGEDVGVGVGDVECGLNKDSRKILIIRCQHLSADNYTRRSS